ncbi:hypothetical protein IQ259_23900 [Fortiea sp. LEGE XX443]|uniref:hypothetical protein n=1 Tax=Fortiea sp. LEGE XX443 TaxID=1828611 RepID=UPI00187F0B22|nr:hypothetical protein [Fortiea sp. LEGE XX443]MBE9008019.1 hypothetical protein [Fortiea sp. LEGE XX443]
MVNIGYHTARIQGQIIRHIYTRFIDKISSFPIKQTRQIGITIYSFSCERDLPEQVASIRSFIYNIGIPERFIVISDGSYSDSSCKLLRRIHPCVDIIPFTKLLRHDLPQCVTNYAQLHPMGKKLAALMSIPVNGATIYTDSDILFFPGGVDLINFTNLHEISCYYLPDCSASLDERLIYDECEKLQRVNAGFLLFKNELDWSLAIERLDKLQEQPIYFTEQTIVHLTVNHNQGKPFCSQKYILNVEDQFIYPDKFASSKIALRHYVNDVRHKFWLNVGL